jgi:CDP-diacylglycerol--glycerol-3-phosphate 3-phosphatidyltransferase
LTGPAEGPGVPGLPADAAVAAAPPAPGGGPAGQAAGHGRSAGTGQPRLVNPANGLTVLRLVLVPFFVIFLVTGGTGWRVAAFVLFAVASATDLLDGRLARQRGLITDFGKIADPVADKALTGAAFITLSALGQLSWWVTAVILVRELGITAMRMIVIRRNVIAASRGGKLKTLLQMIAISLYVLPGPFGLARPVLMGAAVVVTLVTGADYLARAWRGTGFRLPGKS